MKRIRQALLAGILAALLLLTGCTGTEKPIPEEYQQVAVVEFE